MELKTKNMDAEYENAINKVWDSNDEPYLQLEHLIIHWVEYEIEHGNLERGKYNDPRIIWIHRKGELEVTTRMIQFLSKRKNTALSADDMIANGVHGDATAGIITTYMHPEDAEKRRGLDPFIQKTFDKMEEALLELEGYFYHRDKAKAIQFLFKFDQLLTTLRAKAEEILHSSYILDRINWMMNVGQ